MLGFFFGEFRTIMKEPFLVPQERWFEEAKASGLSGNVIHYSFPNGTHSIMIRDADIAQKVLSLDSKFPKKVPIGKNLFGNGLPLIDSGEDWKRHRRIIHPSFQPHFIRQALGTIVPENVERLVSYWKRGSSVPMGGREIDVATHFLRCTLDILGLAAFGHQFNAMDSIKKWSEVNKSGVLPSNEGSSSSDELSAVSDKLVQSMNAQIKSSPKTLLFEIFGLGIFNINKRRLTRCIDEATNDIIEKAQLKVQQRSKHENSGSGSTNHCKTKSTAPMSLLEVLLSVKDNENQNKNQRTRRTLSNKEMRDEIKAFILAGHETTATLCTWCTFVLCKHPDIQVKVFEDIMKFAPSPKDDSFPITLELVNQMPYFNAFMKEVLRLYPPAGLTFRTTAKNETVNGVKLVPGSRIALPIQLIHKHPDYWVNPEEFQPERWLTGTFPASNKHAYLPFGSGMRDCIGEEFAKIESKLIMAPLIRSFCFSLAPSVCDAKFTASSFVVTKPKPDLKVCIAPRISSMSGHKKDL
jgi:cytochrome P450